MEFSTIIKGLVEQNSRQTIRQGEITAITNDSGTYYLTIKIAGDTTSITKVRYSSGLTPRIGQIVFLQVNGNDIYATEELAGANRTLAVRAIRTTDLSLADSTNTAITFDSDDSDSWNVWDVSNATRLTVPIPGRYIAIGQLHFAAADNGIRRGIIRQDGSTDLAEQDIVIRNTVVTGTGVTQTNTAYAVKLVVTTLPFTFAANSYIELVAFQNSGGALNIVGTSNPKPSLSLIYLGP